jgi:hypothetical protein
MPTKEKQKLCFVIAPIGEEGSEVRLRSDQVLNHIITPAANECGYQPIRADKISEPGMITSQVIQHLIEDALVIADITGRNPNVFYELAVRHAIKKPIVQIIQIGEPIPFDVAQSRTIQVDHHDLDSVARCKGELKKQIQSVEKDPTDVDTPISTAIDLQTLRQSENPLEKSSADIISMLQDIRSRIGEMSDVSKRPRISPRVFEELLMFFERLDSVLEPSEHQELPLSQFEELKRLRLESERMMNMLSIESGSGMPPGVFESFMDRRRIRKIKL